MNTSKCTYIQILYVLDPFLSIYEKLVKKMTLTSRRVDFVQVNNVIVGQIKIESQLFSTLILSI